MIPKLASEPLFGPSIEIGPEPGIELFIKFVTIIMGEIHRISPQR
jgi:hypothetical protein